MDDWNVVVTVRERCYRQARELLQAFGAVAETDFYNVLTLRVKDPGAFPAALQRALEQQPALEEVLARVVPVVRTFVFQDAMEFERRACEAVGGWIGELAGHSFHVRMHRRGFKYRLASQHEEQCLDHWLVEQLQAAGSTGRITFEQPDYIVALETVGQRAGVSLWGLSDRERYAFLMLD